MMKVFITLTLIFSLLIFPSIASASDWYARPYRPGGYGSSNGSSYNNAFNGIDISGGINWNSIAAGDTLYVCGFHDGGGYTYSTYGTKPGMYVVNKQGTSAQPITIRGDCPGDPGTIFGSGMQFNDNWTLQDVTNNVYSRTYLPLSSNLVTLKQAFERHKSADKVNGIVKLNKPNNTNFNSWQPSSYHLDNSTGTPILYYKPASGSANDYTFYTGFEYPNINFQGCTNIIVKNINLMSSNNPSFGCNIGIREGTYYLTVDNITTRWADGAAIGMGNAHITIKNSKIRDAMSGIYAVGSIQHILISNNEIYDLNQDGYYFKRPDSRGDCHGIALQGGGSDMLIENNHVHDIGGEGIIWYYDPGLASSMTNVAIRYNHVHHIMDFSDPAVWIHHNQRGIEISGNNLDTNTIYNNSIYYNIIHDIGNPVDDPSARGMGIRVKAPLNSLVITSWSIYNNIVYNANIGFVGASGATNSSDPGFIFKNNIIMNSRSYHTSLGGATTYNGVDMNNNIYYPDGPAMFNPNGQRTNFQSWQSMMNQDANSNIADPLFVSPTDDFHLQSGSPAIDNGTDVGLTIDYDGNHVPQGIAQDIGAYEFSALPPCTDNDWSHTDGPCLPDNTSLRTWTKIGSCQGGVTHPNNETVNCIYNHTVLPGDLNNDTRVDIIDLGIVAAHFGQTSSHPLWNATIDIVANNEIDIFDVVFVASRFT